MHGWLLGVLQVLFVVYSWLQDAGEPNVEKSKQSKEIKRKRNTKIQKIYIDVIDRYSICLMVCWFVVGCVCHSLALSLENQSKNEQKKKEKKQAKKANRKTKFGVLYTSIQRLYLGIGLVYPIMPLPSSFLLCSCCCCCKV